MIFSRRQGWWGAINHVMQFTQKLHCEVQYQLVVALAMQGEVAMADSYCTQFGLDPSDLPLQGPALQLVSWCPVFPGGPLLSSPVMFFRGCVG